MAPVLGKPGVYHSQHREPWGQSPPGAREDERGRRRAVAALQRYGYGFDEIFSVLNSEE